MTICWIRLKHRNLLLVLYANKNFSHQFCTFILRILCSNHPINELWWSLRHIHIPNSWKIPFNSLRCIVKGFSLLILNFLNVQKNYVVWFVCDAADDTIIPFPFWCRFMIELAAVWREFDYVIGFAVDTTSPWLTSIGRSYSWLHWMWCDFSHVHDQKYLTILYAKISEKHCATIIWLNILYLSIWKWMTWKKKNYHKM